MSIVKSDRSVYSQVALAVMAIWLCYDTVNCKKIPGFIGKLFKSKSTTSSPSAKVVTILTSRGTKTIRLDLVTCADGPCRYGGSCKNVIEKKLKRKDAYNKQTVNFKCKCAPGFTGIMCETGPAGDCFHNCDRKLVGVCKPRADIEKYANSILKKHNLSIQEAQLENMFYYSGKDNPEACQCVKEGVHGPECKTTCPPARYGRMCWLPCSDFCKDPRTCDPKTGKCKGGCKEGYQKPNSTSQVHHIHGPTCTFEIMSHEPRKNLMLDETCVTGGRSCQHGFCADDIDLNPDFEVSYPQPCVCDYGYTNTACNETCDDSYGFMCRTPCGKCRAKKCDSSNGHCPRAPGMTDEEVCVSNYMPPLCQFKTSADEDDSQVENRTLLNAVATFISKVKRAPMDGVTSEGFVVLWDILQIIRQHRLPWPEVVKLGGPVLDISLQRLVEIEHSDSGPTILESHGITLKPTTSEAPYPIPTETEDPKISSIRLMIEDYERAYKEFWQSKGTKPKSPTKPSAIEKMMRKAFDEVLEPVQRSLQRRINTFSRMRIYSVKRHYRGAFRTKRQASDRFDIEYEVELPLELGTKPGLERAVATAIKASAKNIKSGFMPNIKMDKNSVRVTKLTTGHQSSPAGGPNLPVTSASLLFGTVAGLALIVLSVLMFSYHRKKKVNTHRRSYQRQLRN